MVSLTQERERTRSEVADYLREFADELDPAGSRTGDSQTGGESGTRTATESGAGTPGTGTGDDSLTDDDSTLTAEDDRAAGDTGADATASANREAGEKVTIIVGNESATINPPETLSFAIDVDTDSSLLDTGASRSATFSLRWSEEHVEADDSMDVE